MHTNQTYNSLVIENPDKLALPDAVKEQIPNVKWDQLVWSAYGLPARDCKFNLSERQLYFEETAEGKVELEKSAFTGEVVAGVVITPDKCETVYILTIELAFCMGSLCSSKIVEFQSQSRREYDAGLAAFIANEEARKRMLNSWWFRWLYQPWYILISGITTVVAWVVQFLLGIFVWCMSKLCPIRF